MRSFLSACVDQQFVCGERGATAIRERKVLVLTPKRFVAGEKLPPLRWAGSPAAPCALKPVPGAGDRVQAAYIETLQSVSDLHKFMFLVNECNVL